MLLHELPREDDTREEQHQYEEAVWWPRDRGAFEPDILFVFKTVTI